MNALEIEWWNKLKEKLVDSRGVMEQVEKMGKAERGYIKNIRMEIKKLGIN